MSKKSTRWKVLERETAAVLGGRRIIRESWLQSCPDVDVPDFPELRVDCKAYARFRHHALADSIVKKYGGEPLLITKSFNQTGAYATVRLSYLAALLDKVRNTTPKRGEHDAVHG